MAEKSDSWITKQTESHFIDLAMAVRNKRRYVEEEWLLARRTLMNEGLPSYYKSHTGQRYRIPAGRRALERTVTRAIKMLTPKGQYFESLPIGRTSPEKASNVSKYMTLVLTKKIRTRSIISQLIRSMVVYGLCHLKTSIKIVNGEVWPFWRVIDPFAFYIYPETTSVVSDADLLFEDYLLSYSKYLPLADRGLYDKVSRSELTKPDWPYHIVERLAYRGITDLSDSTAVSKAITDTQGMLQNVGSDYLSLSEIYKFHDGAWWQIYILWNYRGGSSNSPKIISFRKSALQEPLIRSAIHRPLSGELYTSSVATDIAELNILQNDQIAQFNDAVDWEQGIILADATKRHESWVLNGRSLWLGSREDIDLMQTPQLSPNILRAWQISNGMINTLGGAGTIAEGQPGRNMPRAGGAVNNLIDLSLADIADMAELVEQEILTYALGDIYKVATLFTPQNQLMNIPGGKGLAGSILKAEDIVGDYDFQWIGSLQFQDEQVRAQRLLIFLNLLPQLLPMLQAQGYAPNMVELLRMVWRSGLGERGLSEIVVKLEELQQQIIEEKGGNQGVAGLNYSLPNATNGFVKQ